MSHREPQKYATSDEVAVVLMIVKDFLLLSATEYKLFACIMTRLHLTYTHPSGIV